LVKTVEYEYWNVSRVLDTITNWIGEYTLHHIQLYTQPVFTLFKCKSSFFLRLAPILFFMLQHGPKDPGRTRSIAELQMGSSRPASRRHAEPHQITRPFRSRPGPARSQPRSPHPSLLLHVRASCGRGRGAGLVPNAVYVHARMGERSVDSPQS
jgi:hypothetical protein